MNDEFSSNSGLIIATEDLSSAQFTEYTELPCKGFNVIFKAKKYGRWHILKGLKPEFRQQTVYQELLRKEFHLGGELNHSNIVNVMSFEHNELIGTCIVMEYVDGVILSEFLKEKHPNSQYQKLLEELLSAMIYFHGKQIVHRDLKPSNIMVTHNGHNIKVIDFGLADADSYAYLKQPAGTLNYASPEQLKEGSTLDERTDIYAFGKIVELNFPHRFHWLARKCAKELPEQRPNSAKNLLALIRRRRLLNWIIPPTLAVIALLSLLLALVLSHKSIVPDNIITPKQDVQNTESEINSNSQLPSTILDSLPIDQLNSIYEETAEPPISVQKTQPANNKGDDYSAEYNKKIKQLDVEMGKFYHSYLQKIENHQFRYWEEAMKAELDLGNPLEKVYNPLFSTLPEIGKYRADFSYHYTLLLNDYTSRKSKLPNYSKLLIELKAVFRNGEINQEEYEKRLEELGPEPHF